MDVLLIIVNLLNRIRRGFLEHIESWRTEAIVRAENVMTAKVSRFV